MERCAPTHYGAKLVQRNQLSESGPDIMVDQSIQEGRKGPTKTSEIWSTSYTTSGWVPLTHDNGANNNVKWRNDHTFKCG